MQFTGHRRRRTPSVIIVSLIDVLLVVMIFLMVTTTFKKEPPPVLKLALPEAKNAQPGATTENKPLVILIATNFPHFYLNDQPITFDRLQTELNNAAKKDPEVQVSIKSDRNAPVGELIKVIDAAKGAKVRSIGTEVERPAAANR